MKKRMKLLSAVLAISMLSSAPVMAAGNFGGGLNYGEEWRGYTDDYAVRYNDVPTTHWAYNAIGRVSSKNWFNGYPDGNFHPSAQITRSEAAKVFAKFLGLQLSNTVQSSFYDVSTTDWYSPYIEATKLLFPGTVNFDGSVPFRPEMPITREDTIYALVKALGYDSSTQFADLSVLNMFSDQNSISSSKKAYVAVAVQKGIASGHSNGTIGAQDPLTRAEFATLLYRATYIGNNN